MSKNIQSQENENIASGKKIILKLIENVQDKKISCQKVAKNAFIYECTSNKKENILLEYRNNKVYFFNCEQNILTIPMTNNELLLLTVSEIHAKREKQ